MSFVAQMFGGRLVGVLLCRHRSAFTKCPGPPRGAWRLLWSLLPSEAGTRVSQCFSASVPLSSPPPSDTCHRETLTLHVCGSGALPGPVGCAPALLVGGVSKGSHSLCPHLLSRCTGHCKLHPTPPAQAGGVHACGGPRVQLTPSAGRVPRLLVPAETTAGLPSPGFRPQALSRAPGRRTSGTEVLSPGHVQLQVAQAVPGGSGNTRRQRQRQHAARGQWHALTLS